MGKHSKDRRQKESKKSGKSRKDRNKRSPSAPPPSELLVASGLGDKDRCKRLIRRGADVHWADAELCTPLHAAARGGYVSVIKLLLKSGAAVNVSDLKGDTPAHLAARRGRFEAVTQLLRAGPPGLLEERNDRGETVQQLLSSSIARQETQRHLRQEHAREESRRKRRRADSEGSSWEGSEDDEEAWQRRLEREMSPDDYYGAYFDPGMWHGDEYETADDYARRIWEELERKKSRAAAAEPIGASAQKRRHEEREKAQASQQAEARRLLEDQISQDATWRAALAAGTPGSKLAAYTARWEFFCAKHQDQPVTYSAVPWIFPDVEIPSIQELKVVLLHGADGTAEQRKVLRRELVRWHPDKFVAKFGRWLIPGEKERILQRVNGISQVLNALHAEIQAKK